MLLDCVFFPSPILLCSYLCLEQFIPLPEGCPQGYIGVGGRGDDGLYAHCTGGAHRVIDISFLILLRSMASFIEPTMLSLAAITYTNLLLASLSTTATMWIPKAFLALWMLLFLPILVLLYASSPLCLLDRSPISLLSSRTPRRQNGNLSVFILVSELSSLFLPSLSVSSRSMVVLFPSIRPCGLLLSSS